MTYPHKHIKNLKWKTEKYHNKQGVQRVTSNVGQDGYIEVMLRVFLHLEIEKKNGEEFKYSDKRTLAESSTFIREHVHHEWPYSDFWTDKAMKRFASVEARHPCQF